MFTRGFKWYFIRVLSALFAALCLLSTASHGQGEEEDNAPPPTPSTIQTDTNSPSVEQTLVPEGIFAIQLAEALKLGPVPDEAKAEELLSGLGIEPKNGWIAEYPVTPAVLGDVEKGISAASDQRKIALTKDQALKLVGKVKAKLGFDVNPGQNAPADLINKPGSTTIYSYIDSKGVLHFTDVYDTIPKEYRKNAKTISQATPHERSAETGGGATEAPGPQYMANPNPDDINNYYYEQGPPVVTYYSPPDPYYYLYSWVPYPFWSTGFYFPGFFVLNNFHRHVFFNRHPYFVTHHISSSAFHLPLSVGPVNRAWLGHLTSEGMPHSSWFSNSNAQAGARAIVTLNQNRNRSINGTAVSRMDAWRQPFSSAGNSRTLGNAPAILNGRAAMHNNSFRHVPYSGGRINNQPAFNQRTYVPNTPRFYTSPVFVQDRVFRSTRSFGRSVTSGFHNGGAFGGFHGGGNFTSHGGSFPGSSRGGHR
jgi:hypothetical protein